MLQRWHLRFDLSFDQAEIRAELFLIKRYIWKLIQNYDDKALKMLYKPTLANNLCRWKNKSRRRDCSILTLTNLKCFREITRQKVFMLNTIFSNTSWTGARIRMKNHVEFFL